MHWGLIKLLQIHYSFFFSKRLLQLKNHKFKRQIGSCSSCFLFVNTSISVQRQTKEQSCFQELADSNQSNLRK